MRTPCSLRFVLIVFLVLVFGFPIYLTKISNIDLWANLMTGKYLYYFRAFPHYSTFTTIPVKSFVARDSVDWLGQWILYGIYHYGGFSVLYLLKLLPLLICGWIVCRLLPGRNNTFLAGVLLLLLSYGIAGRVMVRHSLFGLCLLPGLVYVLVLFERTREARILWWIPLLLTLWSNLHGSYLVGLVVFLAVLGGHLIEEYAGSSRRTEGTIRTVLVVGFFSLLGVLFVKPTVNDSLLLQLSGGSGFLEVGAGDTMFALEVLMDPYNLLKALSHDVLVGSRYPVPPEYAFSLEGFYGPEDYVAFFFSWPLFLVVSIVFFRQIPLPFVTGALAAVWLGLAFQRAVAYSNLVILLLFVPWIVEKLRNDSKRILGWIQKGLPLVLLGFTLYGGISLYQGTDTLGDHLGFTWSDWALGYGVHSKYDSGAPEILVREFPEAPVYNELYVGSVLLFETWPRKRVFWWPEYTVYDERTIRRFRKISTIKEHFAGVRRLVLALNTESRTPSLKKGLVPEGWKMVHSDPLISLYLRSRDPFSEP